MKNQENSIVNMEAIHERMNGRINYPVLQFPRRKPEEYDIIHGMCIDSTISF